MVGLIAASRQTPETENHDRTHQIIENSPGKLVYSRPSNISMAQEQPRSQSVRSSVLLTIFRCSLPLLAESYAKGGL